MRPDEAGARAAAETIASLAAEPALRRPLLVAAATALRRTWAEDPAPSARRFLARAIAVLDRPGTPRALLADLRLFARLTTTECADLLSAPRSLVADAWHQVRRELFALARTMPADEGDLPRPDGSA